MFEEQPRRRDEEQERQIIQLRLDAPLRRPREQDDVDGLGLFDAQRSPTLI